MSADLNLVLAGFMGTGKTSAGRLAAKRLGREFVDVDALIEEREGCDIPTIFAAAGEAQFRAIERDTIREVAARAGIVIATGGGAVVDPGNLAELRRTGTVVLLTATPETILSRVGRDTRRPLLRGEDRLIRITELLEKRRAAYGAIPLQVATDGLTTAEVAEHVVRLFRETADTPAG
jgi:shikimate kinase